MSKHMQLFKLKTLQFKNFEKICLIFYAVFILRRSKFFQQFSQKLFGLFLGYFFINLTGRKYGEESTCGICNLKVVWKLQMLSKKL